MLSGTTLDEYLSPVVEAAVSTPMSSSSTEAAAGDHDQYPNNIKTAAHEVLEEESTKKDGTKGNKKKKGEKNEKQPRFAFLTKSEVDHLEDGYRWRKYGQKAVKNSPYPRSYYRCTTQKCPVKKRLERSFQDPSIVITTYEGQHNHHLPSTLRGNVAAAGSMFAPMMLSGTTPSQPPQEVLLELGQSSFSQQLLLQMPHHLYTNYGDGGGGTSNTNMYHRDQQFSDYGLLQDIIPNSVFPKLEP
ncbi:hypothetical protein RD792_002359 [Penstemon davidsonii]|uniref:WRKY domain-containing protein n=1 Tax=Penstemon davidsonii TaxID=160366 RepID=A0ABR0DQT7_9LAMI|nr:hypothetical protein RD792_002359 [Penstemon davidsonii]